MTSLADLEKRCVHPFYLQMMGLNALKYGVPSFELAQVARTTSDDEVATLLASDWRARVMGAWLSAGRTDRLAEHVTRSLDTSSGAFTAPPLIAVLVNDLGIGAADSIARYRDRDVDNAWGAEGFATAALQHMERRPIASTTPGQRSLDGLLAIARTLAAVAPAL